MAITCPQCGKEYDVTLFQFGKAIRCDCGNRVDISVGHLQDSEHTLINTADVTNSETSHVQAVMQGNGMSILDSDAISNAYFFPQPIPCPDAIEIEVDGATLSCLYRVTDAQQPTLIHFHGNGEAVQDYVVMGYPKMIHEVLPDINLLMIEYRGYGNSTGRPGVVTMLSDGQRVLEALKIAPERAIAYGRSIGSLYAIELARRCPSLAGLVIESGIANIRERFLERPEIRTAIDDWGAVDREIVKHFDHQRKMMDYPGRVVLLHARNDGLVDISHARRLYEWSGNHHKCLIEFEYGDHSSILFVNGQIIRASVAELFHDAFPEVVYDASKLDDARLTEMYSVIKPSPWGQGS